MAFRNNFVLYYLYSSLTCYKMKSYLQVFLVFGGTLFFLEASVCPDLQLGHAGKLKMTASQQ